jgi:hypothetical protein
MSVDCFVGLLLNKDRERETKLDRALAGIIYYFIPSTCGGDRVMQRKEKEVIAGLSPALTSGRILSPVRRDKVKPTVTDVKGIRDHFFFHFGSDKHLLMRELSCRCGPCMKGKFKDCETDYVASDKCTQGSGKGFKMDFKSGSGRIGTRAKNRNTRAEVSNTRRKLAKAAKVGTFVALHVKEEERNEEQGHSFILAKVTKEAFEHKRGMRRKCQKIGLDFQVGGWYIEVEELVRDPDYPTTFGFDKKRKYTFDAEAEVANNVKVVQLSQKHNYSNKDKFRELPEAEVNRCEDAGCISWE